MSSSNCLVNLADRKGALVPQVPRVTVLMAVYNGMAFLAEAIQSILDQTYADYEFLIVDDGSTDETPEILKTFRDSRIRTHRFDHHAGLVQALNFGLEKARGEYIARMDADDISYPSRLEKQIHFMDTHPEIGVCGSSVRFIGDASGIFRMPVTHEAIVVSFFWYWTMIHPSTVMRRSVLDAHRLRYDENYTHLEDAELWSRMVFLTRFHNLPEPLLDYRRHSGQTVARHTTWMLHLKSKIRKRFLERLDTGLCVSPGMPRMRDTVNRIIKGQTDGDFGFLKRAFHYLNVLEIKNAEKNVYPRPEFIQMLQGWRKDLIRKKYMLRRHYDGWLLFHYLSDPARPFRDMNLFCNAKFVLKCLIGWQRKMPSIAFHMQARHDSMAAANALKRLRRFYPTEAVMLISDGDADPVYQDLAQRLKLIYIEGEHLFALQKGGQMLQRMLQIFLERTQADYLLRIDTDTRCDRRFSYLPAPVALYGQVQNKEGALQGGCVLIPRSLAKKLYESGIFLDPRLLDWQGSWGKFLPADLLQDRVSRLGLISFDWILHWACLELAIPTEGFSEIYSQWRAGNDNFQKRYAFVHPDKSLYQAGWQKTRFHAFCQRVLRQININFLPPSSVKQCSTVRDTA